MSIRPVGRAKAQLMPLLVQPYLAADLGGAYRDRTDDLLNANQALSQLSYGPVYAFGYAGHSPTNQKQKQCI